MRTQYFLRAAVPATAALALLLTGCGPDETDGNAAKPAPSGSATGGFGGGQSADPATPAARPSATSAPSAAAGAGFPGALAPSAQAKGVFTDHQKGDISLAIGPVKVVKGNAADLAKFFKPEELTGKTPYYVTVAYTHTGGSGLYEPYFNLQLRAMVSDQDQATKADLIGAFPQCQSDVPQGGKDFVQGQTEHECAVYLAPSDKPVQYVLWMNKDNKPLAWKAG
ncbi:hypothetical protein ACFW1A_30805 [Kitasatospora sp. NPDC058965]|uniref:hypothetical protein n=1 Tax=Kitasatospora sp. NPDC058965 TaxID=3346682 RepID=UPI0036825C04